MYIAVIVGYHYQTKQALPNVNFGKDKKCNQNFPTTTVDRKHGKRYTRRIKS